jgi:hypothetical protein
MKAKCVFFVENMVSRTLSKFSLFKSWTHIRDILISTSNVSLVNGMNKYLSFSYMRLLQAQDQFIADFVRRDSCSARIKYITRYILLWQRRKVPRGKLKRASTESNPMEGYFRAYSSRVKPDLSWSFLVRWVCWGGKIFRTTLFHMIYHYQKPWFLLILVPIW